VCSLPFCFAQPPRPLRASRAARDAPGLWPGSRGEVWVCWGPPSTDVSLSRVRLGTSLLERGQETLEPVCYAL